MKNALIASVISLMLLMVLFSVTAVAENDGTDKYTEEEKDDIARNKAYVAIGALIAMAVAGLFSAFALGITGSSAVGVVSEKDEQFGKAMVLQVLPMTQGIYGLVTAVLLMMGAGFLGDANDELLLDNAVGITAIAIGLVVGLTGLSAIPQGQISSASISALARNEESFGKNIIFSAMPETMAIFGLLVAILLMQGVGLL